MNEKDETTLDQPIEEKHKEHHEEHGKKAHKDKHLEKIHSLEAKIKELEESNTKLKNDYFKAYADAENIKKRNQAELEMGKKYRIQSFAVDILPAVDNLERSLSALEDKESPLAKGILMTHQQLVNSLKKEGVEEIDALDKPFDAQYHQALMTEKVEGKASNIVIEVLQKGYLLKDRLIRPALVKVSE